jgi:hypothetical protein
MPEYEKTVFCIDSIPNEQFVGFTSGDNWNGFACPLFERAEAERVLRASESNGYTWSYDTQQDVFVVRSTADPNQYEPEIFQAVALPLTDDAERKVYGIGAYSWIWSECEEPVK